MMTVFEKKWPKINLRFIVFLSLLVFSKEVSAEALDQRSTEEFTVEHIDIRVLPSNRVSMGVFIDFDESIDPDYHLSFTGGPTIFLLPKYHGTEDIYGLIMTPEVGYTFISDNDRLADSYSYRHYSVHGFRLGYIGPPFSFLRYEGFLNLLIGGEDRNFSLGTQVGFRFTFGLFIGFETAYNWRKINESHIHTISISLSIDISTGFYFLFKDLNYA